MSTGGIHIDLLDLTFDRLERACSALGIVVDDVLRGGAVTLPVGTDIRAAARAVCADVLPPRLAWEALDAYLGAARGASARAWQRCRTYLDQTGVEALLGLGSGGFMAFSMSHCDPADEEFLRSMELEECLYRLTLRAIRYAHENPKKLLGVA